MCVTCVTRTRHMNTFTCIKCTTYMLHEYRMHRSNPSYHHLRSDIRHKNCFTIYESARDRQFSIIVNTRCIGTPLCHQYLILSWPVDQYFINYHSPLADQDCTCNYRYTIVDFEQVQNRLCDHYRFFISTAHRISQTSQKMPCSLCHVHSEPLSHACKRHKALISWNAGGCDLSLS